MFVFILICGGCLLLLCYLHYVEQINRKRASIIKSKEKGRIHPLVERFNLNSWVQNSSKSSNDLVKKGMVSAGLVGMSVLDVYTAADQHKEVLETLENKFPNEMGDAGPFNWLNKFKDLENKDTTQSYQNHYTGEMGEIQSIGRLEELGYKNVEQLSKNHPGNDLKALDHEGKEQYFSVKSHENVSSLESEIAKSNSSNYVVNSELFQKLKESGKLEEYKDQGINIIDGEFAHTESIHQFQAATEAMKDSADVSDDIPVIALVVFAWKAGKNVIDFQKGRQSKNELGINIGMDAVGVGGRAVGALAGAKICASIGTSIMPGVGTLVGGVVGALGGVVAASHLIKDAKERLKWGDIIEAVDYYGNQYSSLFLLTQNNSQKKKQLKILYYKIQKNIYNCPQVLNGIQEERKMYKSHSRLLARYGFIPRNFKETLMVEYIKSLKRYLYKSKLAMKQSIENVRHTFIEIKKQLPEDRQGILKRYIGEFIVENKKLFIEEPLVEESELLERYRIQKEKCPNHPYKVTKNSKQYFEQLLYKSLFSNLQSS